MLLTHSPSALYIEGTDETPTVIMDAEKNIFSIEGRCIPEDSTDLFAPVMAWMNAYAKAPKPDTKVEIKLLYFNSASSKAMWEFFSLLRKLQNTNPKVEWHYHDDDDEMRDAGEEFASFFNLPFDYVPYQDDDDDEDDDFMF